MFSSGNQIHHLKFLKLWVQNAVRLIDDKKESYIHSFFFIAEKIIIPENIAIKLANSSEVSVDTFFSDFIKQLTKLKPSNQEDFIKLNRSGFNNYLEFISNQLQSDEPKKKNHRKVKKDKKYQDDEDFNLDLESSGDKMSVVTAPTTDPSSDLNDTTIIFDQEQE